MLQDSSVKGSKIIEAGNAAAHQGDESVDA